MRKNENRKGLTVAIILLAIVMIVNATALYNAYTYLCMDIDARYSIERTSEAEDTLMILKQSNAVIGNGAECFIESVDWEETFAAVKEGINDTFSLKSNIDDLTKKNIPAEEMTYIMGIGIDESENIYEWLSDYNADGVKDILDYNLWKSMNSIE